MLSVKLKKTLPGDSRRGSPRDANADSWTDASAGASFDGSFDASADTHGKWAKTTATFAKVQVGHVYAVRVVREGADFYALFRVESHEQNKSCAISWRIVPAPAPAEGVR